jgi:hypothetical protein
MPNLPRVQSQRHSGYFESSESGKSNHMKRMTKKPGMFVCKFMHLQTSNKHRESHQKGENDIMLRNNGIDNE